LVMREVLVISPVLSPLNVDALSSLE